MNKLMMIWAAALVGGFIAVAHHQPAADQIAISAGCAVAALAWLVLRRLGYDRRLRSISGFFVTPERQRRKVTRAEVRRMLRNQSGRCNNPYCRADLKRTCFEVDHVVPKSRGGPDGLGNAQLLCRDCNQTKCAQPWAVFLVQYQERRGRRTGPRYETRNGVTYLPPR